VIRKVFIVESQKCSCTDKLPTIILPTNYRRLPTVGMSNLYAPDHAI